VNFDLTEDEQMLKAVTERFVTDRYNVDKRRAYLAASQGFSSENWQILAEIGLVAAPFDTIHHGLAASQADIALIAEALGRGLAVEPWIDSVLVAGQFFAASAPPPLLSKWIAKLTTGQSRFALANRESGGRGNTDCVETIAEHAPEGWVINGRKTIVVAGVAADGFIVSARVGAEICYVLISADAAGLEVLPYRLIDGRAACDLILRNVRVVDACRLHSDPDLLRRVEARADIARCAEALGIMQMMFDATRDYLRTRKQFSAPLASFQALQHRMVAQYVVMEQARALVDLAVLSEGDAFLRAIAGARAFIAEASVTFGHEMIQMHGGMGVSDELIIGHGHKRLLLLSRYPETAAVALDEYAGIAA